MYSARLFFVTPGIGSRVVSGPCRKYRGGTDRFPRGVQGKPEVVERGVGAREARFFQLSRLEARIGKEGGGRICCYRRGERGNLGTTFLERRGQIVGVGGRAVAGWHSAVITAQGSPELSAPASGQAAKPSPASQSFSSLCSLSGASRSRSSAATACRKNPG